MTTSRRSVPGFDCIGNRHDCNHPERGGTGCRQACGRTSQRNCRGRGREGHSTVDFLLGRVEAIDKVDLRARVDGFLEKKLFTEGQDEEPATFSSLWKRTV